MSYMCDKGETKMKLFNLVKEYTYIYQCSECKGITIRKVRFNKPEFISCRLCGNISTTELAGKI